MLLNTAIDEQQILSKRRRIPADVIPGPSLKWVIEIEKTHTDRLLYLIKSICNGSVLIVAVRESTAGSIPVKNVCKSKSILKNVPSQACSSFIYSNINMVVDTNLPAEAFRSVHRMFFVPHSCSDPIRILNHPTFLELFDADSWNLSPTKERGAKAELIGKKQNLVSKTIHFANIILKIQTSPKELESCLVEMIHSKILEISNKYRVRNHHDKSLLQSCQYKNKDKDPIVNSNDLSTNHSHDKSDLKKSKNCTINDNYCNVNENQFRNKANCKNFPLNCKKISNDDREDDGEYTHLLQCIYGVDDGVFRWGLVTSEESVRSRLLSVVLDSDIERDRLNRMLRDTQLYERHNDTCKKEIMNRIPPSDIDMNHINKNSEIKNDINRASCVDTSKENLELHGDGNIKTNHSKTENKFENKIYGNIFLPASRAYYKMSEIKEFYFPLWGWVWPGCELDGLVSVNKENPPHTVKLNNMRDGRRRRCNAVDVGASPGGWTQCLAAHCASVISIDPGK